MRWLKRMRRQQRNGRVAAAQAEAERSQERLQAVRRHVVNPLREAGDRNQFADMIRASLEGGKR